MVALSNKPLFVSIYWGVGTPCFWLYAQGPLLAGLGTRVPGIKPGWAPYPLILSLRLISRFKVKIYLLCEGLIMFHNQLVLERLNTSGCLDRACPPKTCSAGKDRCGGRQYQLDLTSLEFRNKKGQLSIYVAHLHHEFKSKQRCLVAGGGGFLTP